MDFGIQKTLTCPSSRASNFGVGKNLKPSPEPRRRHNSSLVVLFLSVVNCVALQAENLYQIEDDFIIVYAAFALYVRVHKFRVGTCVVGASSA
jgi:hypothetical protein